jgi:carbon starvation protein
MDSESNYKKSFTFIPELIDRNLRRKNKPIWFAAIPMVVMLIMPAWANLWNMFNPHSGWLQGKNYLLLSIGLIIQLLHLWMIVEGILMWKGAKGNYPDPDMSSDIAALPDDVGGRSC